MIIRFRYSVDAEGITKLPALIRLEKRNMSKKIALKYLTEKYPDRYNFEIIEIRYDEDNI